MDKPMSDFDFRMMSFMYWLRDLFNPPERFLRKIGIRQQDIILDYGCGPGSYSIAAAKITGSRGKVYALDINPLAIRAVRKAAKKRKLKNIETINSDCKTGLPGNKIDIVLMYDVFHHLSSPNGVLKEIHRVLKPAGFLSLNDHHMDEDEIISKITDKGLFRLDKKDDKTFNFIKS